MWHSHRKMEKGEKMTKYDSKWDKNVTNVIPNKTRPQKKKKSKYVEIPKEEEDPGKRVWSMASKAAVGE